MEDEIDGLFGLSIDERRIGGRVDRILHKHFIRPKHVSFY